MKASRSIPGTIYSRALSTSLSLSILGSPSPLCTSISSEARSWGEGRHKEEPRVKGECKVNKSFNIPASCDLESAVKGRAGNTQRLEGQPDPTFKKETSRAFVL